MAFAILIKVAVGQRILIIGSTVIVGIAVAAPAVLPIEVLGKKPVKSGKIDR